jgi:uncharacterized protein YdeI (YjbR/CyaY-like superfamily)
MTERSSKSGKNSAWDVQNFMKQCGHPLKDVMLALRTILLVSPVGLTEHIKWNAPSYCYMGEDRITFNLNKKDCIQLIFHRGAKVKDSVEGAALIDDNTNLLQWLSNDRALVRFRNVDEVKVRETDLQKIISQWIKASI